MTARLMVALLLVSVSCASRPASSVATRPAQITISVVGTSDVHGRVVPAGTRGGLAVFGGYLRNLRAARSADGGAVVVVDAGDMFQGTLESNLNEGAAVVDAYNALGYTAAAIGNHEFDFGPVGEAATPRSPADDARGAIKARAAQATYPLLAANVIDTATGRPVAWRNVRPSTIVEAAGIKVGIIGVTSTSTLATTIALNTRGLSIAPLAPAIAAEARRLRAGGAAVVIVTAHAGGRCTMFGLPEDATSCDPAQEIMEVARQLPAGAVDVIVGGHTHQRVAHDVAGIAIVQSGANGVAFGRVDLVVNRADGTLSARRIFAPQEITGDAAYEGQPVLPDARVAAAVAPAIAAAEALKRRSLGVVLETPFPLNARRESALGNLLTDALRESVPGADVALVNGGGIRAELPAGDLSYGRLFEASPFENRLVTVVLTGEQLTRVVTHDLTRPEALITSLSGVRVAAQCDAGMLRVRLTRASGAPVQDTERLRVIATDFLAAGGDGILPPAGPPVAVEEIDLLMRDAAAAWLERHGGRLNASTFLPADAPRWNYPGERPVRCAP